jgi:heme/copper-type cytochrome/quinol oxidase subunit 3
MTEFASHSTDYEVVEKEPPAILARNLRVASHLWSSATAFFFVAFLFAYFYLRALNERKLWKPKSVDAPAGWGTAIVLCLVASAILVAWGMVDQRSDRRRLWRLKGAAALTLGLVAVVLQVLAWTQLGFGPTDGGFASVYLGWTALYSLFALGSLYWLETILATSFRYRRHEMTNVPVEPGDAAGDADRTGHDIADPVTVNTSELEAFSQYWGVVASIGVATWVVLYLVS